MCANIQRIECNLKMYYVCRFILGCERTSVLSTCGNRTKAGYCGVNSPNNALCTWKQRHLDVSQIRGLRIQTAKILSTFVCTHKDIIHVCGFGYQGYLDWLFHSKQRSPSYWRKFYSGNSLMFSRLFWKIKEHVGWKPLKCKRIS